MGGIIGGLSNLLNPKTMLEGLNPKKGLETISELPQTLLGGSGNSGDSTSLSPEAKGLL